MGAVGADGDNNTSQQYDAVLWLRMLSAAWRQRSNEGEEQAVKDEKAGLGTRSTTAQHGHTVACGRRTQRRVQFVAVCVSVRLRVTIEETDKAARALGCRLMQRI